MAQLNAAEERTFGKMRRRTSQPPHQRSAKAGLQLLDRAAPAPLMFLPGAASP